MQLSNAMAYMGIAIDVYNIGRTVGQHHLRNTVGFNQNPEIWRKWLSVCPHLKNLAVLPCELEMWANAQRDGRPAKYRWRPLFNAAKFDWHPLLECRAVMLPRHETDLGRLWAEVHHILGTCEWGITA